MGLLNTEPEARPSRGVPVVVVGVAVAFALCAAIWLYAAYSRGGETIRTFDNPELGCRFQYDSELVSGPNFVRAPHGSFLTIERHSLVEAEKSFVAGLPDVLFDQVLIQLNQGYPGIEETARRSLKLGGRPSLHVELRGHAGGSTQWTRIAIDIAANDEWVWVLRAYYPDSGGDKDEAALEQVRTTLSFVPSSAPMTAR